MPHIIPKLKKLAKKHGITIVKHMHGHYQLKGGTFLVNYYPHSKKRTAYVDGTYKSVPGITPEKAIEMCFEKPQSQGENHRRGGNSKRKRARLIRKGITECHWCQKPLTLETSTLEHIIPLASNGLDNANNRTLACEECNSGRGSEMPELES